MWSLLLSFLGGPLVTIGLKIADLLMARTQAKTEVEVKLIDEQIQQLNSTRDVIVASQKNPITGAIYWCLLSIAALGPVIYINKIFFWDKVLGAFAGCSGVNSTYCRTTFQTDPLVDSNLWWIVIAVFSFLFLASRKR